MNKIILVIDDDDILRNTLSKGLRQDGFNVLTAQSAENAIEILSRISVDAIVLDRMMSGMDGLTFLKQIRHSGNQTPVIMLTAMTGPDNTIDGLAFVDNEFFISGTTSTQSGLLALSGEEKKLLQNLTMPMGNIVPASPMVAKRLRSKLNMLLSNLDIITVRGQGYKLIDNSKNQK